ncbi:MAG: glycosyltransferase [Lachnospiraceae bacterium]|nr:glycosyltransferase [Lachnospiraceae bacterium]
MQNIALIINTLQGGGAERCAADLSLIFAQRGFRVFLFTDLSIKTAYEYAGTLVDYDFALSITKFKQGINSLQEKVNELKNLKNKYNIDIAISFMQQANYLNILSKNQEKVILTTHSVNSEYAKYDKSVFWSDETFRDLYQYADFITFPSDFCRNDWLAHYGDKNNITRTIYNPVHRMPVKKNDKKENIVIAIGRMHSIKRQWHLIKAFKLVKEMCPDSRLIILGDGELRPELESVISRLHLENDVEMPGNVKDVSFYLEKAKVFAMTSRCEAMPCSVLEALSAGVPVVSCDSPGGIREELGISAVQKNILEPLIGECGIITPYISENSANDISREEEILAEEIVHLLKDDRLRIKMAQAACAMAQKFSPDVIGSVWTDEVFSDNLRREADTEAFERTKKKHIESYQEPEAADVKLYVSYYRLLEKWMLLHEKGGSVKQYFMMREMKNIIIYGLGKMANHLLEDIKESNINVVCAIDIGAINKYSYFPVITLEEDIPGADCIIITPVHETESIMQNLKDRTSVPLISLSDIVDECLH